MFLTRCPKCEASVETEEGAALVRCSSCGHKIKLRETAEDKRKRRDKARRLAAKNAPPPPNPWIVYLPAVVCVPLSLFALGLTCLTPVQPMLVIGPMLVGMVVSIVGFAKGCMIASHDGNFVSFDYLGMMEWMTSPIAIGCYVVFCGLAILLWVAYIIGYFVLWEVALIGCAIKNPKVYLPWLGLQTWGALVIGLSLVCAVLVETIWSAVR